MAFSPLASPTATIEVLKRHGLFTKKRLGQHFLVDDRIVGRILELAAPSNEDVLLEVGPGIGTLTVALCEAARSVVAVERDPQLLPVLSETLASCFGRVHVIEADAMEIAVREVEAPFGPPVAMVANLPYSVAASVVLRFLQQVHSLSTATVMVQAEVADRMAASPGTKSYGAYTVKLRLLARTVGRFKVPRASFLPPPRVDSAVIRLERNAEAHDPRDVEAASAAASAAFAQRRKTIRNSLLSRFPGRAAEVDAALSAASFDPGRRAETYAPEDYLILGSEMRKHGLLP